jgi:hypothetical protein
MNSQLTVHEILELHHSVNNTSVLAKSIGDGFLFANNSLYRNIRKDYLKRGFTLTTEDFCHYVSMPFLSLDEILKQKKVPYFDNVTPIEFIEKTHPKLFKCEEIIKPKTNHVLHESSHCLAEEYLKSVNTNVQHLSREQNITLKMIMAEAFANAVESVCNSWNTTAQLRLFYEMNSYIIHYKKINQALTETIDLIGLKNTFALVYLSYFVSNCLQNEISQSNLNKLVSSYFEPQVTELILKNKCATRLFNHAFELSMDFRLQTTGFYCQMRGLKADIFQLVNIDLVQLATKTQVIQTFLKQAEPLLASN